MTITEMDRQFVAHTYNRFPVELVSGKGSRAYDTNGKEYVDMGSGIGVLSFGYCDPVWQSAVTAQLGQLQHTSNLYYTAPCAELAAKLCEKTGMSKVFFCNSGAEANECAIKAARQYGRVTRGEACSVIVTMKNSFHGRTLTTLAATGQDHYHEMFTPLTPGFVHATAGDFDEFVRLTREYPVCGVMLECVQGEGGVIAMDPAYVKAVAEYARENGILVMIDEVQTGNGRTGKMYAYMHYGITPDIVSTAKGLGGGLPIGATLLGEKLADIFGFGDNGSTFGGNPAVCAGALSIVNRLTDSFLTQVTEKGSYIRARFDGAPGIESVSGLGLMVGLKTVKPCSAVVSECLSRGVLCLTAKDKVRLLPALNIPQQDLDFAVNTILDVCR